MPSEQGREEVSFPKKRIIDGFDEVAMGLAAGTISRRQALKLTGTALLGGSLLAMFPSVGGAQSLVPEDEVGVEGHRNPGCEGEAAINNRKCPFNRCGPGHGCVCAETVDGRKRCVNVREAECPNRDQCDSNRECPQGEVCAKVGGCCGERRFNLCMPLCS
jgi:hypothetical protein